jgi:hypothetical protein
MKKINIKVPKIKQRFTWGFNPVSRVVPSKKLYNRKKSKGIISEY